jgi:ATP-dependent Clp protease adapter protein ClpS
MSESKNTNTTAAVAVTPPRTKALKKWKVIVHNDDINTYNYVIKTFIEIVRLDEKTAYLKTVEVDKQGLSIVAITHKEHAEFIQGQLQSKALTVTIEPD